MAVGIKSITDHDGRPNLKQTAKKVKVRRRIQSTTMPNPETMSTA
jgi:hypothetical protein